MTKSFALLLLIAVAVAGCSRRPAESTTTQADLTAVGSKYLVASEPADAKPVAEAIVADDQAEVTVVGRIGGSENPWVDDMAAFTIVDPALKACSDIPGDNCDKPWDYCCESSDTLKAHSVAVKFMDEKGSVVPADARKLFGVEPLQTVVIRGKLQKDESGKTAVIAEKMYVQK
jgi:hypothetical protein